MVDMPDLSKLLSVDLPRWYHGPIVNTVRPEPPKTEPVVLDRETSAQWLLWAQEEARRQAEKKEEAK